MVSVAFKRQTRVPAEAFTNTNIGTQFHYNILQHKKIKRLKFTYHEWTRCVTLEQNSRHLFSAWDCCKAHAVRVKKYDNRHDRRKIRQCHAELYSISFQT